MAQTLHHHFRSTVPLSLPLLSTLNHLQCTHFTSKSRTPVLVPVLYSGCCYLLDGGEVSAFVIFRASPPQPPQHLAMLCTLLPCSRRFGTARRDTQLLHGLSYLGNRAERQRLLVGGSRTAHDMVLLCWWIARALSLEQKPPPPFPWSCCSRQGGNRHSHVPAPLCFQLVLH